MNGTGERRADLSPEEKLDRMFDSWLSPQKINFIDSDAERAYRERVTRIKDVLELKVPDRVPIYANIGFFPACQAGISTEEAMSDYDKLIAAWRDFVLDLQPDVHGGPAIPGPGKAYEILDYTLYLSQGRGESSDSPCIEKEYMKADEYDALIRDTTDFMLRKYMPRIFGKLEPFEKLGSVAALLQMPFTSSYLVPFGRPDVRSALESLMEAGEEALKWQRAVSVCNRTMVEAGYPIIAGGSTLAPYDVIADTLRGTWGVMADIYRQPDKLIEAMERLTPVMVELGAEGARSTGRPLVLIPLHKGADGFMSDEQYRNFYWHTLKKTIQGLIDEGLVPFLFAEGEYGTRLEVIQDVPVGKTIWHFDFTDMAKAKAALAGIACIAGNVPVSLLDTGTTDEVKAYCKGLIEVAGKGGGFIMTSDGVIDKARPENVRAMIDFTKEYGVYS